MALSSVLPFLAAVLLASAALPSCEAKPASFLTSLRNWFRSDKETLPMTPGEIISQEGYPSEEHHVTTEDGYILQIDRIPRTGRPVIYLAHQLSSSAAGYLILGKGKSIGFLLFDAGFDVWLSNFRGTHFSIGHERLSSAEDDFWKFGWHEHGAFDNPAIIEYVLKTTAQEKLVYLGHSMGGTTFFVTASERPDLLSKISAAFLFAPAVFLSNTKDIESEALAPFVNVTQKTADTLHLHKQPVELLSTIIEDLCDNPLQRVVNLCGRAGLGISTRYLADFAIFFPAGGSAGQLIHYLQLIDKKWPGFRKYNYGSADANRDRYGRDTPPDYSISHITTPVYLYNGQGDTTCTREDQTTLRNKLPNVQKFFYTSDEKFGHRDFALSDKAVTEVFQTVVDDLKPFLK